MQAQVANAIRRVAATMQKTLDAGRRSPKIDANDLIDMVHKRFGRDLKRLAE